MNYNYIPLTERIVLMYGWYTHHLITSYSITLIWSLTCVYRVYRVIQLSHMATSGLSTSTLSANSVDLPWMQHWHFYPVTDTSFPSGVWCTSAAATAASWSGWDELPSEELFLPNKKLIRHLKEAPMSWYIQSLAMESSLWSTGEGLLRYKFWYKHGRLLVLSTLSYLIPPIIVIWVTMHNFWAHCLVHSLIVLK